MTASFGVGWTPPAELKARAWPAHSKTLRVLTQAKLGGQLPPKDQTQKETAESAFGGLWLSLGESPKGDAYNDGFLWSWVDASGGVESAGMALALQNASRPHFCQVGWAAPPDGKAQEDLRSPRPSAGPGLSLGESPKGDAYNDGFL
jgi:hypothetical protein